MKRVTLESSTKRFMGPSGLFAILVCIAIIVAFGFWCDNVKRQEDNKLAEVENVDRYANAVQNRDAAFQGAVVGFLLLFAVKHLREDF